MKYVVLLVLLIVGFAGCNFREREGALKEREAALAQREQMLLLKEQGLQLRELELQQQTQRLDSTLKDTAVIYNQDLVGRWNVKMTCTETSCHGSAVGDSKTEAWDIYYNKSRIIAKVMNGDKLARVYTGSWTGSELVLTEEVDMSPGIPTTQMFVRLTMSDVKTMDGQREIVRPGDCKILYSVQLKKQ